MWLPGLRAQRVPGVSSSGKEEFQLGLLEQREKNPLSPKERSDTRFYFQHRRSSAVAHKLCVLAPGTFCSKPNLLWKPINIQQEKNW